MKENYFLAKWLNKEITEDELKKYVSEEEIRSYKKIIAASENLTTPVYNTEENLEKIKALHSKTKVKKLHFPNYLYRVAAVITVLFASYYFVSTKSTTYETAFAEKINFELPDASVVALNADSKITFNKKNWKKNRTLELDGEAFFNVKKGKTFIVKTEFGSVQVLGTQFNVIERDRYFKVHCYEGLVSVTYNNKTIKVAAGNSLKVLNDSDEFIENLPATNPDWLQHKSSFNSMPYNYVIKELERQYNVTISYDNSYENSLFTGNFTHTNLDTALQAISIPLNLKYTILNDKTVSLHP